MNKNGTIVKIEKGETKIAYICQGVKIEEAHKYNEPDFFGGNGTYRIGYPETNRWVILSIEIPNHFLIEIEVRELILSLNNRKKLTDKFFAKLKSKIIGEKVTLTKGENTSHYNRFSLVEKTILKLQ